MKRAIMVFLLLTGFIATSKAQKQTTPQEKNFRICFVNGQYVVCDPNAPITAAGTIQEPQRELPPAPPVHKGNGIAKKSHVMLSYDDPNAPYKGENSAVNDGVKKNEERNINYLDGAVKLPPSDGGLSNRR